MGNFELWEVACLKLYIKEVVELGLELGLSECRAGAFSFGEIMPISPFPSIFFQRQNPDDLDVGPPHCWCWGRTITRGR